MADPAGMSIPRIQIVLMDDTKGRGEIQKITLEHLDIPESMTVIKDDWDK